MKTEAGDRLRRRGRHRQWVTLIRRSWSAMPTSDAASAMKNINDALKIRHPTTDPLYNQSPNGQVYEPLDEDACAGLRRHRIVRWPLVVALVWSFAINGWPIVQTVSQAMAELRRKTPSQVVMFTAGALEQGRNGWTHQRPEIESYSAAMMRNGNHYRCSPAMPI